MIDRSLVADHGDHFAGLITGRTYHYDANTYQSVLADAQQAEREARDAWVQALGTIELGR